MYYYRIIGITLCNEDGHVIIRHIAPGSVAADASHAIRKGDAIEQINGESVNYLKNIHSISDFRWLVKVIERYFQNLDLLRWVQGLFDYFDLLYF